MCHGEEDAIYAEGNVDKVVEMKINDAKKLKKLGVIPTPKRIWFWGMCYIPAPHHVIVLSGANEVRAISCISKKTLWRTSGEVKRKRMNPRGLLFLPNHNALLVADGANSRVVVLDPGTGIHRQTVDLPGMEMVCCLGLLGNSVAMMHGGSRDWKLSFFSLK